jgi:cation diffusion facilitator CzcD-associated flavoprotein CzcO/acetyl esterase/lipase
VNANSALARPLLRALDRAFMGPGTPLTVQRAAARMAGGLGRSPRGTIVSHRYVNGVPGIWCRPPGAAENAVLLYLHGGGYVISSAAAYRHLAAVLAGAAGTCCFIPDYRLAPRAPFPAALRDAEAAYEGLLAEGRSGGQILLGGDSAGGGLALALAMALRDRRVPGPAAVALLCPWLDLTCEASRRRAGAPRPTLCTAQTLDRWAELYAGGHDRADPQISPLHGDLSGLAPLLVVSAGDDVLADDAARLAARAARHGARLAHRRYPALWHGFYLTTALLPEAEVMLGELGRQLAEHLAPRPRPLEIAIVGAGVSGICLGALLARSGVAAFTVYEKAGEVGGTWRDNTYPGLHCDVPARLYSYSFAPEPSWSRLFAPGAEIQRYLRKVTAGCGLDGHVQLNTEVTRAEWDGGQWQLSTSAGPRTADVLVTATGFLRRPVSPDIPGLDRFGGSVFHSARWDAAAIGAARSVAVIGTGASGVQIVSALAGSVDRLLVFQRTPQWIFPIANPRSSRLGRAVMRRWPLLDKPARSGHRLWFELLAGSSPVRAGLPRLLVALSCRAHLRLAVPDRDLRRRLQPPDAVMCKRLVASGTYYRALQRDDVALVDSPITEVTANGLRTADGICHAADVIVLATGFDGRAFARPLEVTGVDGTDLARDWAHGPRSYCSVALAGFPNYFMMIGPYSPIGNQSQMATAETQASYIVKWMQRLALEGGRLAVMPTADATDRFEADARRALRTTTWVSGCRSWYTDGAHLPVLWPWTPRRFRRCLRSPEQSDFEYLTLERTGE